jgi:ATP-dependent DNA helicase RecQ
MNRIEADLKLKEIFGLDRFYDIQWEAINKIFNGQRILLIEKTGFGKSLCYQFPATQFSGTTIVFSPLIALMRDQIKNLNRTGIIAKCINSEQTDEENSKIISEAKQNIIKILYIAPERMENIEWLNTARQMKISMVVIDEAHCISVWGHDFRPAFRRIINLVNLLPSDFPVLATTATANKRVECDIIQQMGGNISSIRGNLIRPNFNLSVISVESEDEKLSWLGKNIGGLSGTGIIYTGTRVNTDIYASWLKHLNVPAVAYSARLDAESRKIIEDDLLNNKWKCVVSTNALGMGIDKPDIRFIIHTQIPQSPIHYYQEIGRGGRDGKPTDIFLLYSKNDTDLPKAFIENSRPGIEKYYKVLNVIKVKRLSERELMRETNLKQTQVRVIKADLIEQNIINEVIENGKKKYEYRYQAPELNIKAFEDLRKAKLNDLDMMVNYAETGACRMKFLCDYLGDISVGCCGNCDNDKKLKKSGEMTKEWGEIINAFKNQTFPILEVEKANSILKNGVAASYYGFSNVGSTIHKCKYENGGDFPDSLIQLTLKAFNRQFKERNIDIVLFVPPTESGDLVKNFAEKIAKSLSVPISNHLEKLKKNKPQKIFQNGFLKSENVKDVFFYKIPEEIKGKCVLVIDDIFDSGATIKEIGKILSGLGAKEIIPLVIAKTVGGDIE